MRQVVIKRVTVPHDDFLDFLDAMKSLRLKYVDEIMVSQEIFMKLDNGKWHHRNYTTEFKPIIELEKFGVEWYLMTVFRNKQRDYSHSNEPIIIYIVQFDNEIPLEITVE